MLLAGAAPWLSGPRSHPAVPRVPNRAQPLALSTTCGSSASQAGGSAGVPQVAAGCLQVLQSSGAAGGRRSRVCRSLSRQRGNWATSCFPTCFVAREFSPRFALGTSPIQLLVHTCCSPPTQQAPAKALLCHQGNGAVPGALAAACQPAQPGGAGTGSPQCLPPAGAASRSAAGPARLPGRAPRWRLLRAWHGADPVLRDVPTRRCRAMPRGQCPVSEAARASLCSARAPGATAHVALARGPCHLTARLLAFHASPCSTPLPRCPAPGRSAPPSLLLDGQTDGGEGTCCRPFPFSFFLPSVLSPDPSGGL